MSKAATDSLYTVSIDFWEQYDPSEIGAKGFALIGSELFHVPAICYLCGSAGKEPVSDVKLFIGHTLCVLLRTIDVNVVLCS